MLGPEGGIAIAEGIRASGTLTECNLLNNEMDSEAATVLAQISKERKISLCGITLHQTKANFSKQRLQPADAILIAAAMEFRGDLMQVLSLLQTRWTP